jgi:hypothetical protein
MKQYEYNVLTNRYHIKEEVLNLLGKKGWELVSHTYTDKSQSIEDEHVYTFKREKIEEEPGWSDPMMEMLGKEEKESEWQRRRRLEVMKEARMNPNPAHYESREITVEDIHKIHRDMMEKERTDEMERTYGVVIDEIKLNGDFTGMNDNNNPTFRYKGVYYTLDNSFKKILEERIERPPHWWWDALEPK